MLPIIAQCLEGIQRCTDSMDEKEVENGYQIFCLQMHGFDVSHRFDFDKCNDCNAIIMVLQDSRLAVEKYKSGFSPPGNI